MPERKGRDEEFEQLLEKYNVDEIEAKPKNFYSHVCNRWISISGVSSFVILKNLARWAVLYILYILGFLYQSSTYFSVFHQTDFDVFDKLGVLNALHWNWHGHLVVHWDEITRLKSWDRFGVLLDQIST